MSKMAAVLTDTVLSAAVDRPLDWVQTRTDWAVHKRGNEARDSRRVGEEGGGPATTSGWPDGQRSPKGTEDGVKHFNRRGDRAVYEFFEKYATQPENRIRQRNMAGSCQRTKGLDVKGQRSFASQNIKNEGDTTRLRARSRAVGQVVPQTP